MTRSRIADAGFTEGRSPPGRGIYGGAAAGSLGILEWFDCIETIKVDTLMAKKRWSTETARRYQRFLKLFCDSEL